MRRFMGLVLAVALWAVLAGEAAAHFIWVVLENGEAQVYFSEGPYADAERLVKKIAHAELLLLSAEGEVKKISPELKTEGENAYFVASLKDQPPSSLAVRCQYGVYKKHLLNYAAQYIAYKAEGAAPNAKAESALKLAVTPTWKNAALQFQVMWDGKPLAAAPVFIADASSQDHELKTDDAGLVSLKDAKPGIYHIRTSHMVPNKPGDLAGVAYEDEMYQSTLVLELGPKNAAPAAEKTSPTAVKAATDPAATELLNKARAARALWEDFPGFSANVEVNVDGKVTPGKLVITAKGKVELELADEGAKKWAERQLDSLVTHRMPGNDFATEASFEDDVEFHPLGRKIRLAEDSMGSVYRIRDNAVTQVNRDSDGQKFTISVLDTYLNPEGKYLPSYFAVTFWNAKTGEMAFSQTHKHTWQRLGTFDLPAELMEVHASAKEYHARSIKLSDVKLLEKQ